MKSVLYVGATLMIGASIYGFVDYKQTSYKKEFTNMYVEEKANEHVAEVALDEKTPAEVNEPAKNLKKTSVKKKPVKNDAKEDVIKTIKPIAEEEQMTTSNGKTIETGSVNVTPSKEHSIYKKTKRKKLNTKIFSRAPLRDEVEEIKVMPKKADTKEKQ